MPVSVKVSAERVNKFKNFAKFTHFYTTIKSVKQASVGGVMASIVAFQAVDPGSTPGRRTFNYLFNSKIA